MRLNVVRASLLFTILFILAIAAAFGWGINRFHAPGPSTRDVTVVLAQGTGVRGISSQLVAAGIIFESQLFRIGVRLSQRSRDLKAGEYMFPAKISAKETMDLLLSGRTVVRRVTVPEGLTSAEIVGLLRKTDGLDGVLVSVPEEGSLLPETYHFSYGYRRVDLLERMRHAMRDTLAALWQDRPDGLPLATPREAMILASIIEKETSVDDERAHVAGVFVNRLRRGMRLQSDPTVRYAVSLGQDRLSRPLTRADLNIDSPFNTYRVKGLPPTPIANPGYAAIQAAIQPLATLDLYFVADGSGGHAFAQTLREHSRNVAKWRRLKRSP